MIVHVWRKDNISRQKRLKHSGLGEGDYGTQSHTAEPYSCLQVWVFVVVENNAKIWQNRCVVSIGNYACSSFKMYLSQVYLQHVSGYLRQLHKNGNVSVKGPKLSKQVTTQLRLFK